MKSIARGEGAGLTRPLLTANLTQSAEGTAPVKTPSTSLAHLSMDRAMIRNARCGRSSANSLGCLLAKRKMHNGPQRLTC